MQTRWSPTLSNSFDTLAEPVFGALTFRASVFSRHSQAATAGYTFAYHGAGLNALAQLPWDVGAVCDVAAVQAIEAGDALYLIACIDNCGGCCRCKESRVSRKCHKWHHTEEQE